MTKKFYQIRIFVTSDLLADLRSFLSSAAAKSNSKNATDNFMEPICNYDAFYLYCNEAEQNGLLEFLVYHWTKSTIELFFKT